MTNENSKPVPRGCALHIYTTHVVHAFQAKNEWTDWSATGEAYGTRASGTALCACEAPKGKATPAEDGPAHKE